MPTITDYFNKYSNGSQPLPTTLSAQKLSGATSASLVAATGWDTTGVKFVRMYQTTTSGGQTIPDQTTLAYYKGTLSGTTLSNLTLIWSASGSDPTYPAGATVDLSVSAGWTDALISGLITSLDQDGTLKADAVDNTAVIKDAIITRPKLASAFATEITGGWLSGDLPAVSSVTALGNRSYTVAFASTVASTLSEGMRLRTTRTVAAPTQCTSLNGSSQYYSKTSPNKLTFTDDFVVSAWVKPSSYASGIIASRYNGTSGWGLYLNASGQVALDGYNAGASNYSRVLSYQTVPLNKWTHITAQLDMSTFTATTTTSYVMFDGKDVPASVVRGGTNPTALIQAGNLEIGSWNGGTAPFPGKIAQVAIYSAKVTQATILASISQGLTGSETSLASAFSFNNSIADLNTTTPNDLTAQGSAVATNADSPFGNGGVSSTLDYGLVMAVSTTDVTVQVPEGVTIPTTGGITSVAYSTQANPFGWVSDKGRWEVKSIGRTDHTVAGPVQNTFYGSNVYSLTVPIGAWRLTYCASVQFNDAGGVSLFGGTTLSTSTSAATDVEFDAYVTSNDITHKWLLSRSKDISVTSATVYQIIYRVEVAAIDNIYIVGSTSPAIVTALPSGL